MFKKKFNCEGCFADSNGECIALSEKIEKCPFKKSRPQYYTDQHRAAQRLVNLQKRGLFNPDDLVNLHKQAQDAMEMVRK